MLANVHTRAVKEEELFSRGCGFRDLLFSIWLSPRAVQPLLNRMIFLKQLKRQRRNRSFVGAVIPQGELQGIMACCNPTPPLVHQQINELHQLLLYSRGNQ
ncbi:exosome component 10-like [Carassius auratus]|uniref:Exosome component 10-like n=1 Tax=Carassius auratus TaxID=7957 RepID=A0A6P6J648_CARAU|nr:exosome component 10-like [Carassius auratus]